MERKKKEPQNIRKEERIQQAKGWVFTSFQMTIKHILRYSLTQDELLHNKMNINTFLKLKYTEYILQPQWNQT